MSTAAPDQSGFAYTLVIYFITFIVLALLWGLLNGIQADIVVYSQSETTAAEATKGIGWMQEFWDFFPLVVAIVMIVRLIAKAAFTSEPGL